ASATIQCMRKRVMSGTRGHESSEKLVDRLDAVIDQADWPTLRTGKLRGQGDAQSLVDGRRDLGRSDRPILGGITDFVGSADGLPPLDRASREKYRPAGWMVIASAGRIDFGGPPELPEREDHRRLQQSSCTQVFQERRGGVVEVRPDLILVA